MDIPSVLAHAKDYQTIIGSIFGIIAAVIAYKGVVYSQQQMQLNARAERDFQAARDREHHRVSVEHRRDLMIASLIAELNAIGTSLHSSIVYASLQKEHFLRLKNAASMVKGNPLITDYGGDYRITLPTIFFDEYRTSLGLLPQTILVDLASFYSQIKALASAERMSKGLPIEGVAIFHDKMAIILEGNCTEAYDLARRLNEVKLGKPDPGRANPATSLGSGDK